jgi:hypothetical protein
MRGCVGVKDDPAGMEQAEIWWRRSHRFVRPNLAATLAEIADR